MKAKLNKDNQYETHLMQRHDKEHLYDFVYYVEEENNYVVVATYNKKTNKITFVEATENYLIPEYLRNSLVMSSLLGMEMDNDRS
jgi:hypothetical protein